MNSIAATSIRSLLVAALAACACSAMRATAADLPSPIAGLAPTTGFVDIYRDTRLGRVLIGIHQLDQDFLLVSSLPGALGSNDVGLDRGQPGEVREVAFRRVGKRVMLVQRNSRFIADSRDALERAAATDAFAESVLWAADVVEDPGSKSDTTLVDFSAFLAGDRHGIVDQLKATRQGNYSIDEKRSGVLPEQARSFPDNAEFEALLTLQGDGEGEFVKSVAMDPHSLSLRQHISLVRLPPAGFQPRAYHPGSGGFSTGYFDFAQPLSKSLDVRWQPHFRLDKTDPTAAISTVKKPIVFYLDPGTPEPVRSALLEGANWWKTAFEKAGYKDAYRVELLPEGADPMDIRYNIITWAHRATRGWSYGAALTDPRNGEIIKGSVTLGSQRVRQDILIAESLLSGFNGPDAAKHANAAQQMALARLRQLAAHEVGHALGFAHNFAASRHPNGSVMDYPHPLLELDADGGIDLTHAYGIGVGRWDEFLVQHAYGQFAGRDESSELAALRQRIAAEGFEYIGDADARAPGDAHPDALLWDSGADTLASFDRLLKIRHAALARFSIGALPPDRQLGELEARLVPVYLLHRYQTEAVARMLGGASYRFGLAGEGTAGTTAVAGGEQHRALRSLLQTLDPAQLALPANVLDSLTPPSNEYMRNREYFATRAAPLFDPMAAVESATALTSQFLFDPSRLNRLAWQHARDAAIPSVAEVLDASFQASWGEKAGDPTVVASALVQQSRNWIVLDALMAAANSGQLHPAVDAEVRAGLHRWKKQIAASADDRKDAASREEAAERIGKFLDDPNSIKLRVLPTIPPGAPI